jgi:O-antigen/teichoic acid export membrane protein
VSKAGAPRPDGDADIEALAPGAAGPAVIRGGAVRAVGYGASVLLGLAAAPFLIRHLGVRDFGRYVTITSLVAVVQGFSDAGLTQLGVREYATRTRDARDRLVRNLVGIRLVLSLLGIALALTFVAAAGYDRTFVLGTVIASVGGLLIGLQATFVVPLLARLRLGLVTAFEVLRQAAMLVLIVAAVVAGAGLLAFLGIWIAAGVLVAGVTAAAVLQYGPLRPALDRGEWRRLLRDTAPIALAAAAFIVSYRIAVVVLSLVSTEAETGYFSVSYRVIEALATLPSLLVGSAFPVIARAAEEDENRLRYVLQRLFDVGVIGGAWLALMTVAGADLAVRVLGGAEFESSTPVLEIQGLSLAATFLLFTWGFALLALRRNRALIVINVAGLLLAGVATAVLAAPYGAKGAAAAMVLTEASLAFGYGLALMRARGLRPSLSVVPRVAVSVAVAGATVVLLGLPTLAALLLATVLFVCVLALVGGFPREIRDAFAFGRGG